MTQLFVALAIVAWSHVIMRRRQLRLRSIRWRFFELRDELRWAAIVEPGLASSPYFADTDRSLSEWAEMTDRMDLWMFLPLWFSRDIRESFVEAAQKYECAYARLGSGTIREIRVRQVALVAEYTATKHPVVAYLLDLIMAARGSMSALEQISVGMILAPSMRAA